MRLLVLRYLRQIIVILMFIKGIELNCGLSLRFEEIHFISTLTHSDEKGPPRARGFISACVGRAGLTAGLKVKLYSRSSSVFHSKAYC